VLAALLTHRVVQWLAVGLFAVVFAIVVVFGDPVGQVYAYPLIALAAVAGFAVVVRRGVAPVVFTVAFVLAVLPTAGVARYLGRDGDGRMTGNCTVPIASFFTDSAVFAVNTEDPTFAIPGDVTVTLENRAYATSFDVLDAQPCGQRAGQRLATSLATVLVGVLLVLTASRGPTADFRVRGPR
jgi:hypothetical protein